MTVQELRHKIKASIIATLNLENISPSDIDDDMQLFEEDGLALDSLDAVELVVMLEKEYGVVIADSSQARKVLPSVAVLADFVLAHTKTART